MKLSARTISLTLLLLFATGWLAWIGFHEALRSSEASHPTEAVERPDPGLPSDESSKTAAELGAEAESSREALATASTPSAAGDEPRAKTALLHVLVRAEEGETPLAGFRVFALQQDGDESATVVEGSAGRVGEAPRTDEAGRVVLEVEPGKTLTVFAQRELMPGVDQQVDGLAAGETLELVLEIQTREDVRLFGQLVDGETGAALVGSVKVVRGISEGRVVQTDESGRFELTTGSWESTFASAEANGHAHVIFALTPGFEDPSQPRIVRLSSAGSIEVLVRDRHGAAMEGTKVELSTESYRLQDSTLDFLYLDNDPTWIGRTDSSGKATIEGLLPRVPLSVTATAEGWPRRKEPHPLLLVPGERREIEIVLGAGATIIGILQDAGGAPIPLRSMWCVAAESSRPAMLNGYFNPAAKTQTDAEGRFRFEFVPAGTWWIGAAPNSEDDIPPVARVVTVTDESAVMEIVIRVERGLFLAGNVLDPAGEHAARRSVQAIMKEGQGFLHEYTNEQGAFSLGPLASGTWTLVAGWADGEHACSESIEVEAGRTDLVLRLRAGGSIRGEVVDRGSGKRCESSLFVARTDSEEPDWLGQEMRDGQIELSGLVPGTYLVAAQTRDGRTGVTRGVTVTAGVTVEGVRVDVAPGATLVLSYEGSDEYAHCTIHKDGDPIAATSFERMKIERVVVPPGTIEIRWREHESRETEHVETVTVGEGEELALELAADSR